jgi:hypothetical protein
MERVRDESQLLIRKCFAFKKSKQAIAFFLKIKNTVSVFTFMRGKTHINRTCQEYEK